MGILYSSCHLERANFPIIKRFLLQEQIQQGEKKKGIGSWEFIELHMTFEHGKKDQTLPVIEKCKEGYRDTFSFSPEISKYFVIDKLVWYWESGGKRCTHALLKSLLEHLTEMANISQKSKYWMSVGKWMSKFGCSHVETSLKS